MFVLPLLPQIIPLRLIFKSSAVIPARCSLNGLERDLLKECSDCIWWVYVPLTVSVPHWMCQVFNWGLVLISELILSRSTSMLTAGGLNWQCKGRKKKVWENYHCTIEFLWLNWLIILSKEHWETGSAYKEERNDRILLERGSLTLHSQIIQNGDRILC